MFNPHVSSDVLDRELWRPADVPPPIQEMVVLFDRGEEKEGTGGDASGQFSIIFLVDFGVEEQGKCGFREVVIGEEILGN